MRADTTICRVYLAIARHPRLNRVDVADLLDIPVYDAQLAICRLVAAGRLTAAHERAAGLPAYEVVPTRGHCEICGTYDSRLIAGECPQCRCRTVDHEPGPTAQEVRNVHHA